MHTLQHGKHRASVIQKLLHVQMPPPGDTALLQVPTSLWGTDWLPAVTHKMTLMKRPNESPSSSGVPVCAS